MVGFKLEIAEQIFEELQKNDLIASYDKNNFICTITGNVGVPVDVYRMLNETGSRCDLILNQSKLELKHHNNKDISSVVENLNLLVNK